MAGKALILDLDDTIFQTKSMDPAIFQPFADHFASNLKPTYSQATINQILDDMWVHTWDKVISRYNIPMRIVDGAINVLDAMKLRLDISTYPDYDYIKELAIPKYLVTTGLTSLQKAKISALKIDNDFEKVMINDPFRSARTKLDVFKELVAEFGLNTRSTYVVGDNPDSEIKAGNELDMVTIQILREGVIKGHNAGHYINSFHDLERIVDTN